MTQIVRSACRHTECADYISMYDTIIIGAGMSGLAAGIRLAHFGQRVCILERHSAIGGLNSFYRQGGRTFDVGLHALTNYTPKGTRTGPLARLLRQLRITWDQWALAPQLGSAIIFPNAILRFSNEFELLESEVRLRFPRQIDNFRRLVASLHDYDQFGQSGAARSARKVVGEIIDDPLLVEMILCPILFYGGSREHDIDFDQFSIMFRAIFLEGFARPMAGIQLILKMLVGRFKEMGGELRLRAAVAKIVVKDDAVEKVVLQDGTEVEARNVLSSAGWTETMRLCDDGGGGRGTAARPAFVRRVDLHSRHPAAHVGLRQDNRLLQRFRAVPLREARRSGGSAQRRGLLAEQFLLRGAAAGRDDADLRVGQLRPLGGSRCGSLSRGEGRLLPANGGRGGAFRAGLPPVGYRHRLVHAVDDPSLHRARRRRRLWLGPKKPRRHHASEEPLHLRQRSRAGGHRRHDHQRHQHRQSALVEMSGPCHNGPGGRLLWMRP